jgi:hypothetical protein
MAARQTTLRETRFRCPGQANHGGQSVEQFRSAPAPHNCLAFPATRSDSSSCHQWQRGNHDDIHHQLGQ